ncbi:MAG: type II toxin-antitoxin system PemK/MazF family toxin [Planctomycetes bacterium]|nr:type II toxin-antitoxin system PemK/MazF family toxin [Planctomycetota bacterium]
MVVKHGEIWWADLDEPRGSEPGFIRPILVVQSDYYNRSNLKTVIVLILTSNLRLAGMPGNVLLSKKSTGLPKRSVANVTQLMTINKSQLDKRVKRLAKAELAEVEAGVRLVLSLL